MQPQRFSIAICFILIHSTILIGCQQGHKAKDSTGSKRASKMKTADTSKKEGTVSKDGPVIEIKPKADKSDKNAAEPTKDDAIATVTTGSEAKIGQLNMSAKSAGNSGSITLPKANDTDKNKPIKVEAKNSIDKRKGKLSTESFLSENGNKIEQSSKPCSVDQIEKGDKTFLDIKLGDLVQLLELKKEVIDTHLVKLEEIKAAITFKSFDESSVILSNASMTNFKNIEKNETGVIISRSHYAFKDSTTKTEEDANKKFEQGITKLTEDKDFKEVDVSSDGFKFLVKDKVISQIFYFKKRYLPGSAVNAQPKILSNGKFKVETELKCELSE